MVTHAELVARAARWLRNTVRCGVVATEEYNVGWSIPDAIGWKSHTSYLVECKVTRSDFFADAKKHHRRYPDQGMGHLRYYMTPPGLVSLDEVPEHWGLLEARPKQVRVLRHGSPFSAIRIAWNERPLLIKLLKVCGNMQGAGSESEANDAH